MAPRAKLDKTGGKPKKGSGMQRRWGGKMGKRVKVRGGYVVVPASSSGSGGKANVTFECGQSKIYGTKEIPGRYRVSLPPGTTRYSRPTHPISESGEWWNTVGGVQ